MHPKNTWSRNDGGFSRSPCFINLFHKGSRLCYFLSHSDVVHVHRPEKYLADEAQTGLPKLVLSPIHFPEELFRTVSPSAILQVVVRRDPFRGEPLVLQCRAMILSSCNVVDVSKKHPDIRTKAVWTVLERHMPCWHFFQLCPLLVNCGFRIRSVHGTGYGYRFVHQVVVRQRIGPLSAMRSPSPLASILPVRVLVDSWALTRHAYLALRVLESFSPRVTQCPSLC